MLHRREFLKIPFAAFCCGIFGIPLSAYSSTQIVNGKLSRKMIDPVTLGAIASACNVLSGLLGSSGQSRRLDNVLKKLSVIDGKINLILEYVRDLSADLFRAFATFRLDAVFNQYYRIRAAGFNRNNQKELELVHGSNRQGLFDCLGFRNASLIPIVATATFIYTETEGQFPGDKQTYYNHLQAIRDWFFEVTYDNKEAAKKLLEDQRVLREKLFLKSGVVRRQQRTWYFFNKTESHFGTYKLKIDHTETLPEITHMMRMGWIKQDEQQVKVAIINQKNVKKLNEGILDVKKAKKDRQSVESMLNENAQLIYLYASFLHVGANSIRFLNSKIPS